MDILELGIIGLGKMGGNIARHAHELGIKVIGKDIQNFPELEKEGITVVTDYAEFASKLTKPRVIFLSLPAGRVIDLVIDDLIPHIEKGDILLDGGNSFFMDSKRREGELSERGIIFLDCGTSGGVDGARHGACFMVGGIEEGIKHAKPILEKLAVDGGYLHTGPPGSGHFVKLVHNGIEFGMLQAIGEGISLLTQGAFKDKLDLVSILDNWAHGSVIRSWLIELMRDGLKEQGSLEKVPSFIEDTGEVNWLVQYAINNEIPLPAITQSIIELFKSRGKEFDMYRAIALMRHGFGGHPFGPDEYIQNERKTSRLSKL